MDFDDLEEELFTGGQAQQDDDAEQDNQQLEQVQPQKPKRAVRRRPKLTLELLQAPNGLQEVFDKFPKWFQEGYKGKGHEVRDLRRLLELYQRWQPRLFNYYDYNQFESALEKMSGTNAFKVKLQDMRAKLPELVDPKPAEQQEDQLDGSNSQQQQQQQEEQQQGAARGMDDMDEEEFLQLQAEAMLEANEAVLDELMAEHSPQQHAAAVQPAEQQPLAAEQQSSQARGPSPPSHTGKRSMRAADWSDDDDDDDDLDMRPQQHSMPPLQQQQQQRQHTTLSADEEAPQPDSLEDDDMGTEAAAPQQPARGRLRKRQVVADADSDDGEGGADARAAAGLEDSEGGGGLPPGLDVGEQQAAPGSGDDLGATPRMRLMVGTEFEATERQVLLLDDDDDDDDDD